MNEKPLRILLVAQLTAGLAKLGVTTPVIASHQPTTQGREDSGIYFYPITDNANGWQSRKYNGVDNVKDTQIVETAFQVTALIPDNPASLTQATALDVLQLVRGVVGSLSFVEAMQAAGVGVQRPTSVRTPYFVNDRGQFEMSPSFDFTVSHKRDIIQLENYIDSTRFDIHSI